VTGSLARRYARALLDLAREERALEAYGTDVSRAADAFSESRLRAVVLNPGIDAARRLSVVRDVVGTLGLQPMVGNLVCLLAQRDRIALLPDVSRAFGQLVDRELGRTRVRIVSAAPLAPAEREEVVALAKRLVGRGEVLVTTEQDAELLGGVLLGIGDTVYDGSLRTQLARLSTDMAGDK